MVSTSYIAKPPFPRLQGGHRLANGLIGAWPFYEDAGATVVRDESTLQNPGSFSAAGITWGGGPFGSALTFDGNSGTGIAVPGIAQYNVGSKMSAAIWVKGAAQTNKQVYSRYDPGTNAREWCITTDPGGGGLWRVIVTSDGSTSTLKNYVSSGTAFDGNTWNRLLFTFNTNVLRLFLNGQEDLSVNKVGDPVVNSVFFDIAVATTMGCFWSGTQSSTNNYAGSIDMPMHWNRDLSPDEAAQDYYDSFRIFRRRYVRKSSGAVVSAVKFRKSASRIGTRTGTRQTWAA